jgi:RloB-like protein
MKSKKAEQIAQKRAHKTQLREAKNRRTTPDFELPEPTRIERQRILIVCEGLNTEPDYFRQFRLYFRLTAAEIVEVGGAGETIRVVERALKERERSRFDQVWVVFDKDDFPPDHFDNAIHMAHAAGIRVAYSNQAFKYWLLLHFEDHQGGGMHRDVYADKLNSYLKPLGAGFDAKGSKQISAAFFKILMGIYPKTKENRMNIALKRAEKIYAFHNGKPSPALAESSTTVFELVIELLKFVP